MSTVKTIKRIAISTDHENKIVEGVEYELTEFLWENSYSVKLGDGIDNFTIIKDGRVVGSETRVFDV